MLTCLKGLVAAVTLCQGKYEKERYSPMNSWVNPGSQHTPAYFSTRNTFKLPKRRLSGLTLCNPERLELGDAKGTSCHPVQQVIVYMAGFGDNCPRTSEVSQWLLYLIPCQKFQVLVYPGSCWNICISSPKYNVALANSFEIVKIPKYPQIICMSTEVPIIILAQ